MATTVGRPETVLFFSIQVVMKLYSIIKVGVEMKTRIVEIKTFTDVLFVRFQILTGRTKT